MVRVSLFNVKPLPRLQCNAMLYILSFLLGSMLYLIEMHVHYVHYVHYVKPSSTKKTALLDHITDVYKTLRSKHGKGLYSILAGDTNDLKLGPILRLNANLKSFVKKSTRINPKNPLKLEF